MLLLPEDMHKKRGERDRFKFFCSSRQSVEWGRGKGVGSSNWEPLNK